VPIRVFSSPDTPVPGVQLLSNGRYHVMVTNAGGGYSRWKDLAVTRWREDSHLRSLGQLLLPPRGDRRRAQRPLVDRSSADAQAPRELRSDLLRGARRVSPPRCGGQRLGDFETYTEIVVSPEDDIELRRVRITNRSRQRREIEVTSYAEVVIAPPAADALHPAFSNLFVQTEILRERQAILCTRRPRSLGEQAPWMLHLMVVHGAETGEVSYETDRLRFIGRTRSLGDPLAMGDSAPLSGSEGSVLDPIVAIRCRIVSIRSSSAIVDIVSASARPATWRSAWSKNTRISTSRTASSSWRGRTARWSCNSSMPAKPTPQLHARLASSVIYANASLRADAERADQESPRAVRAVGLRHLRRSADRPAADRRRGQHRSRAPARAGACLLAPEGTGGGPGDLERGSRRLPAAACRNRSWD
jgi:cyclic beta-1,2-glucan synthetase